MKKDEINWDDVSFVKSGKHRKRILELLDKPRTPTEIKDKTGLHFNAVSRAVIELEDKSLVVCLTPKMKHNRLYQITDKGKKVLDKMKEL